MYSVARFAVVVCAPYESPRDGACKDKHTRLHAACSFRSCVCHATRLFSCLTCPGVRCHYPACVAHRPSTLAPPPPLPWRTWSTSGPNTESKA